MQKGKESMKVMSEFLDRVRHDRKIRRLLVAVTLCLSVVVALGVYWSLHTDGLAKTHTHAANCIGDVLICDQRDVQAHHHDASCYAPPLVCGIEAHTHTDACYDMANQRPSRNRWQAIWG